VNRSRAVRITAALASIALAVVLVAVALPKVANAGWDDLSDHLAQVTLWRLLELVGTWAAGLYVYTFVLTAALPKLKRRRALALNLGGSGISNVLPFGGAAGIGLNYAMLRSWGYDREHVARFTVVSQTVTALSKVLLGAAGLIAIVTVPALRAVVPLPEETTVLVVLVGCACVAAAAFRIGARLTLPAYRRLRASVVTLLKQTAELLHRGWLPLTAGTVGYAALQLFLFELCLNAVHAGLPIALVAAGYAVDRLLTLIPVTPGGVGVVEAGVTAVLVAVGGDPTAVATGVLLFRAFTYFAEIPLGGAVILGWFTHRTLGLRRADA
jgi:uncharacterized membrane protein YbhN (UPF0104 family)